MSEFEQQEFTGSDGHLYRLAATEQHDGAWLVRCAIIEEPGGGAERMVRDSLVNDLDEARATGELWRRELAAD